MKKHETQTLTNFFDNKNRRQAVFFTAAVLIGVMFLFAIIMILTGQSRPFADETPGRKGYLSPSYNVSGGNFNYKDARATSRVSPFNTAAVTFGLPVKLNYTLQARGTTLPNNTLSGKISIVKTGGSFENNTHLVVRNLDWTDASVANSRILTNISNDGLRAKESTVQGPFTIVVKPLTALSKKVDNVIDLSQPIDFGEFKVGDVNMQDNKVVGDDEINAGDLAVIAAYMDRAATGDLAPLDLNGDGIIDAGDLAVIVPNIDSKGVGL